MHRVYPQLVIQSGQKKRMIAVSNSKQISIYIYLIVIIGCNNCSKGVLNSLDELWGQFNNTASEFDTLVLNSLDDLPDLGILKDNFNKLSRDVQLPLTILSSLKYSLTGLYTNFSYYLPQSYILGCSTPLNTSILQYYSTLQAEIDRATAFVSDHLLTMLAY